MHRLTVVKEVSALKDDWKSVTTVAGQMKEAVDRVRAQCEHSGTGEDPLPAGLQEPLEELGRYVKICRSAYLTESLDA